MFRTAGPRRRSRDDASMIGEEGAAVLGSLRWTEVELQWWCCRVLHRLRRVVIGLVIVDGGGGASCDNEDGRR